MTGENCAPTIRTEEKESIHNFNLTCYSIRNKYRKDIKNFIEKFKKEKNPKDQLVEIFWPKDL